MEGTTKSFQCQFHGTVVAAQDTGVDLRVGDLGHQTVGDHEIVDAPAGILLPGLEAVRPPRIFHPVRIERAEGVAEATGQQVGELLALLVGEAGIVAVGLGVLDVYLLVGNV